MPDVIVVGGGPAGAAAATFLARRGIDVVVLERREFPRDKPCGDCLSPGANAVLKRLGVWAAIQGSRPARLLGWRLRSPGGAAFTGRFHPPADGDAAGLALPRSELDSVLLQAARSAGAVVRTGIRVRDVLRHNGAVAGVLATEGAGAPSVIRAPLTVGADGLRSVVVRRLGLLRRPPRLRKVSLTAHVDGLRCSPQWGELHIGREVICGLAPVGGRRGERTTNLTVVVPSWRLRGSGAADPRRTILELASELDGLRARLKTALEVGEVLASGPFDWPVRRRAVRGAVLVGDAAGYYDPLTGQGIYHALAGAEILADEIANALETRSAAPLRLRSYERRHRRLTRSTHRLQWLIEQVVSRPALADAAFQRLAAGPAAADALVNVTGDLRRGSALLSPRVWSSLAFGAATSFGEISR